ncbi:hypothetical protein [Clostridium estertheticum]|uniref:Uncharacterized protein n=1 Tax=Clostridium estertheticum TaxID=238834 RepID=A0A7Y3WTJ8_9CLOT|nr:hypothetical protein [Clostridium estertheticum]MBW9171763.1 hypothetical protein [Clostridium estertheticum]NNU77070.1 hypothetical protein [Clostridium estertheticum]WBL47842.1 hypothetical protein LOR37_04020 [Clostridium estertheticum]WLC75935.1 hypothetical protein KTC99_03655 [Clostridium estertheticum]
MELLLLNILGGFIFSLVGTVLYYRNRDQKAYIILIVVGILQLIITVIRIILK